MKYFILMSSFLLFSFSVQAQFARQEQRPEYFIPEKEIVKVPSIVAEPQRIQKNSSETVNHISAKTQAAPQVKPPAIATTATSQAPAKIAKPQKLVQDQPKMKIPHFQKKYDEYHKDILTMKKTKRLPVNRQLKKDLSKMSGDERFEVVD